MSFDLIPVDFGLPVGQASLKYTVEALDVQTRMDGVVVIIWEKALSMEHTVNTVALWGWLRLMCTLTDREVLFPMPYVEGLTVQSINQSALIGELAQCANDAVILLRVMKNYETKEGETVFTDGSQMVFRRDRIALELVNEDAHAVIHTFCHAAEVGI